MNLNLQEQVSAPRGTMQCGASCGLVLVGVVVWSEQCVQQQAMYTARAFGHSNSGLLFTILTNLQSLP